MKARGIRIVVIIFLVSFSKPFVFVKIAKAKIGETAIMQVKQVL